MRAPGCTLLQLLLLNCVSSLAVFHTQLDHEDVKVMKCIVEVLADALSRPQSLAVSQQCVETLRTDDRLVTLLRRRNFLQELQDIAGEGLRPSVDFSRLTPLMSGANERSKKEIEEHPDHAQDLHDRTDQSMVMEVPSLGENDISNLEEVKEGDEKGEVVMKKTGISEDEDEEEDEAGPAGKPEHKHVEEERLETEQDLSQKMKQEESKEMGQEQFVENHIGVGKQKHWSRSREPVQRRAYDQQEVPHHKKVWKSPEEELQLMAHRGDREEGRDPEEGSATRNTEDAEMESLAVMENELENMAQKLHELRHG